MFMYRIHNNDTNGWFRSQELQLKLLKKQLKKMKRTTKQIMHYKSAQITSSTLFGRHLNSMGVCKAETQDKWDLVKFYVVSKRTKVTHVLERYIRLSLNRSSHLGIHKQMNAC